ncbi:hypothetical protein ACFP56_18035 [Paenibacillus septentrionalis]|uniref:Histidine kinase n=1 Tax=Paenibacillus septentrionalis TaxID=429342 RepID=A0ABW1V9U5_9BACL
MIIIAIAYLIFAGYEVYYLQQRNVPLKPYITLYSILLVISEVLYYFRDDFQIIEMIRVMFDSIEQMILLK